MSSGAGAGVGALVAIGGLSGIEIDIGDGGTSNVNRATAGAPTELRAIIAGVQHFLLSAASGAGVHDKFAGGSGNILRAGAGRQGTGQDGYYYSEGTDQSASRSGKGATETADGTDAGTTGLGGMSHTSMGTLLTGGDGEGGAGGCSTIETSKVTHPIFSDGNYTTPGFSADSVFQAALPSAGAGRTSSGSSNQNLNGLPGGALIRWFNGDPFTTGLIV